MDYSKKNIVVADDDADDRFLFDEALNQLHCASDYALKFAEDGQRLIELLNGAVSLPNAIFLDLNMPVMDGMQCLKELRQEFTPEKLPIIIFSTSGSPENIRQTYKLGANRYIQKPSDFKKLSEVLDYCLCSEVIGQGQPANIDQYVVSC